MITLIRVLLAMSCFAMVDAATNASDPEPLVVAHRGLMRHAPENTLANFRGCLELRIGFEFDVERTKDGHLVCIHDSTVDRTTDGIGPVSDLTLAQIRELDAGSWFDPTFSGEKVPTVDEVLGLVAEYRRHDVLIAVDLKAENVGQDVVRLAEKRKVLHRLLFIGRTISEPKVRDQIRTLFYHRLKPGSSQSGPVTFSPKISKAKPFASGSKRRRTLRSCLLLSPSILCSN